MERVIAAALLTGLMGCQTEQPTIYSSSPDKVVVSHNQLTTDYYSIERVADAECAKYERDAVQMSVESPYSPYVPSKRHIFACMPAKSQ